MVVLLENETRGYQADILLLSPFIRVNDCSLCRLFDKESPEVSAALGDWCALLLHCLLLHNSADIQQEAHLHLCENRKAIFLQPKLPQQLLSVIKDVSGVPSSSTTFLFHLHPFFVFWWPFQSVFLCLKHFLVPIFYALQQPFDATEPQIWHEVQSRLRLMPG